MVFDFEYVFKKVASCVWYVCVCVCGPGFLLQICPVAQGVVPSGQVVQSCDCVCEFPF
jgi:hypothetical protein